LVLTFGAKEGVVPPRQRRLGCRRRGLFLRPAMAANRPMRLYPHGCPEYDRVGHEKHTADRRDIFSRHDVTATCVRLHISRAQLARDHS